MVDLSKMKYELILLTEKKKRYNVTASVITLGWEENEKELSTRITFTAYNSKTKEGYLSSIAKLGCLVLILVNKKEVVRGRIVDWKPTVSNSSNEFECTCYDELYNLQESQDNIYYSAGIGTKSAITQILKNWSVPVSDYSGPDVKHGKLVYKSEELSNVILDILEDAAKKGGGKCVVRAVKGKVSIQPIGSNPVIYHFGAENTSTVTHKRSTAGMVTRVKILGQEDKKEKASVEATLNGKTEFGIRQKIYIRQKDDSLEKAKTAAQEILKEEGVIQEEISVQSPDVPFVRKGDTIHLMVMTLKGYYQVMGIQHDADTKSMTMELKKTSVKQAGETDSSGDKKGYHVGDLVSYHGGIHYVSSDSAAKGFSAKAGKAKITKGKEKSAHPWHLIHEDAASNVYGWVDQGSFH